MNELKTQIRMRDDLAQKGYQVPAYFSGEDDSDYFMLNADDLIGATLLPDTGNENEYKFNRVLLNDGQIVFMVGVDLDFGDAP